MKTTTRPLVALAVVLVQVVWFAVACSSDDADSEPGSIVNPADGALVPVKDALVDPMSPLDASVDGASRPIAHGDPCRGTPLPVGEHFVPAGMCARIVATSLDSYRQLTFAPSGDLFAVTADGRVTQFHDANGDGVFDSAEVSVFAESGGNGNNCDIDVARGYLYVGGIDGVKRFAWAPNRRDGGAGEDFVIGEASTGAHAKHTVHVWDGLLYVQSGSVGNQTDSKGSDYDDDRGVVRRFDIAAAKPGLPFDWLTGEIVSRGLRNPNGFARSPSGRLFAVVNGIDGIGYAGLDIHDDNPGEQVAELVSGAGFGFPFCFTAQHIVDNGSVVPPGTQLPTPGQPHDAAWCLANSRKPATFLQAHSAPLDIQFFGSQPVGGLPERHRGGAFIALHGSFDRDPATGYSVVWLPFDAMGTPPMPIATATGTTFPYETVFGGGSAGGAVDGPWTWTDGDRSDSPRFSGVAISPVDGALYAASDVGRYIYRIGKPNPPVNDP